MTKLISILSGRCLVVELPSWETIEKEFSIHGHDEGLTESEFKEYVYSKCPPGNWQIIGMLSEVTEKEAALVVPIHRQSIIGDVYKNFKTGRWDAFDALESLESAILADGWCFENPYGEVEPKYDGYNYNYGFAYESPTEKKRFERDLNDWQAAQYRVLDRSRCLLLGREV